MNGNELFLQSSGTDLLDSDEEFAYSWYINREKYSQTWQYCKYYKRNELLSSFPPEWKIKFFFPYNHESCYADYNDEIFEKKSPIKSSSIFSNCMITQSPHTYPRKSDSKWCCSWSRREWEDIVFESEYKAQCQYAIDYKGPKEYPYPFFDISESSEYLEIELN